MAEAGFVDALFDAIDHTWPAFAFHRLGVWTLREGRGGGQRVCAASTDVVPNSMDVRAAEVAMAAIGQHPLFVVKTGQDELDSVLAGCGYTIKDPVDLLVARSVDIELYHQPDMDVIFAHHAMPILAEIWAKGGIHQPRIDVMNRAKGARTFAMGRTQDRAAAVAFGAIHRDIAMFHAVEVLPTARRKGVAERLMQGAAWWALQEEAKTFCVLTTCENAPAQRLYRKLGMESVARYHYRVKAA